MTSAWQAETYLFLTSMMQQRFKRLFLLLSTTLLSACYPIYKTLQPKLDVVVQNEQGQLLNQVPVVLMRQPSVGLGYRYTLANTQQGRVHFDALAEWRVEFMLLHGAVHYDWYLCVAQSGYEVQSRIPVDQQQMTVVLKKLIQRRNSSKAILTIQLIVAINCQVMQ